eukprot:Clim_evm85s207 gene=Clim_evmTU85s207
MVDVSTKKATLRTARAIGTIKVPSNVMTALKQKEIAKGDVFTVAKIAGINAAKMTFSSIPLCHQIPLSSVKVEFDTDEESSTIAISAETKTTYTTGVEMEALQAVSCAALTIYDMCKAMSHDMIISDIKVVQKTGGKRDFT